ncbi:MAG: hypothetical protein KF819_38545 [Labilithrix sp.]|nr:hypothetical protein [Labilithrix sp.]
MDTSSAMTRFCMLPPGTRVRDVADACRSAALGFAWGAHVWGRRELARWLAGPYATAVAATRPLAMPVSLIPRPIVTRTPRSVSEASVVELVAEAHARLMRTLRTAHDWRTNGELAREMVDAGLVAGVMDDGSAIGYAPINGHRMRLVERVASLFIADYLTRAGDYATFEICDECASATFDAYGHVEQCPGAPRSAPRSVLRRRAAAHPLATLAGLGPSPPGSAVA